MVRLRGFYNKNISAYVKPRFNNNSSCNSISKRTYNKINKLLPKGDYFELANLNTVRGIDVIDNEGRFIAFID